MWGHPDARQWYSTSWRAFGLSYRSCKEIGENSVSEPASFCFKLAPTCIWAQRWWQRLLLALSPAKRCQSITRLSPSLGSSTSYIEEYRNNWSLGTGRTLRGSEERFWDGKQQFFSYLFTKDNNLPTCPQLLGEATYRCKVQWDLEQWGLSHWLWMCCLNTTQIPDSIRVRKGPLTIQMLDLLSLSHARPVYFIGANL